MVIGRSLGGRFAMTIYMSSSRCSKTEICSAENKLGDDSFSIQVMREQQRCNNSARLDRDRHMRVHEYSFLLIAPVDAA